MEIALAAVFLPDGATWTAWSRGGLTALALVVVAACAPRPVTEAERAFAESVMGDAVDLAPVRVVNGSASALLTTTIPPRPRTTCREKLFPPRDVAASGSFPAFVSAQTMYYARDIYQDDLLAGYPDRMSLVDAMRFAHELTHVWQWQNRRVTGFSPFAAASEHVESDDPYLIDIDPERSFLDYGWEQQGILVEEFVCCRALDPDGARTSDLARVIGEVFPARQTREAVPQASIALPWPGVELNGVCG